MRSRAGEPGTQKHSFNVTFNGSYTSNVSVITHTNENVLSSLPQIPHEGDLTFECDCSVLRCQSGADTSIDPGNYSTGTHWSCPRTLIQINNHNGSDESISGSLQNSPYKGSFGNYSLQAIKGATSDDITLGQGDRSELKHGVTSGLHSQWGLLIEFPLLALNNMNGTSIEHSSLEEWVQLAYKKAKEHNRPNYSGARVKVVSQLNIRQWRSLLRNYKYNRVTDYLEFGFPLSLDYDVFQYNDQVNNHSSALNFPTQVEQYLQTEKQFKAMAGPFDVLPFDKLHTSPMMTRAKPDGSRRLIVDLSWPQGASVNSSIPDDTFDNVNCKLKYPTLDTIVEAISITGKNALLYKVDLKRAYRNLRSDPRDFSVLGLSWQGRQYVDVSVPFGLKTGASACQMVTDSISHLMKESGYWTCAYLDDIVGVSPPSSANSAFLSLNNLITSLGLPINHDKVSQPVDSLTCLGINIDVKTGTLTIPEGKIEEVRQLCEDWANRTYATRKSLQKLVGHLIYINKCVRPARLFVNRILQTLRNTSTKGRTPLQEDFHKDINWFREFMATFNGVTKIHSKTSEPVHLYVDACLTGIGGYTNEQVYSQAIPHCYRLKLSIVHFEMLNVMVAFRLWAHEWDNSRVEVHCDNAAVVSVLNSGSSRDLFLAACARTLWLIKAQFNIIVTVSHIRGKDNIYADILSRWPSMRHGHSPVIQYLKSCTWHNVSIDDLQPNFSI